jgi:hydrogenase maturation protease
MIFFMCQFYPGIFLRPRLILGNHLPYPLSSSLIAGRRFIHCFRGARGCGDIGSGFPGTNTCRIYTVNKSNIKALILGLGNPILSDDGVGTAVAHELESRIDPRAATVIEASLGGLNLLDLLVGYERVIIVDAIKTGGGRPGQVYRLDPAALPGTRHTGSAHDINLVTALELGKKLNLEMPSKIDVFAIEVAETESFGDICTPAVAAAIPVCADMILEELGN